MQVRGTSPADVSRASGAKVEIPRSVPTLRLFFSADQFFRQLVSDSTYNESESEASLQFHLFDFNFPILVSICSVGLV